MSFNQIFERFNRLARTYAPEFLVGDSKEDADVREARRLIDEHAVTPELAELERLERERLERERLEREKAARELADERKAQQERLQAEQERLQAERRRAERERAERERLEREMDALRAEAVMTPARARAVLGVAVDAGAAEVQAAYRALIVRVHPDRTAGLPAEERERAGQRAVELNMAYALLKDHSAPR